VSFYVNENTDPVLQWARAGETLVTFDPSGGAGWRQGSDPADPRWCYDEKWQARTLAVMERLTGVRLGRDLLEGVTFRCAAVPDPHSLTWMRANPDRIGPQTEVELAIQARNRLAAYAADPDRAEDGWANEEWDEEE
jgi:hypothetical protein